MMLIIFCLFLLGWIFLNIYVFDNVDPYPFILLNLILSCIAAIQAPIIMMSQNRLQSKLENFYLNFLIQLFNLIIYLLHVFSKIIYLFDTFF